jgi:SAM-dependent methyltransferase
MGSSSAAGHETPPALARYLEAVILPLLPSSTDASMADLGCGGGDLLTSLNAAGYTRLAGVDLSTQQIARCHARGLTFVIKGMPATSFPTELASSTAWWLWTSLSTSSWPKQWSSRGQPLERSALGDGS